MGDEDLVMRNQISINEGKTNDNVVDLPNSESNLDASLTNKTSLVVESPSGIQNVNPEEIKRNQEETALKRDKSKMPDYYKAWDKFDIDSELVKLDENQSINHPPKYIPNPQTEVIAKDGKEESIEINRLKDQGNSEFSGKRYEKALEKYQECLIKDCPNDLKIILYSNSAECYLRLKCPEQALTYAEKALSINSKHIKSLLRRAKAKKKLGKFRSARSDLDECLALDPANPSVLQEKIKLEQKRTALLASAKAKTLNKSKIDQINVITPDINIMNSEEKKEEEFTIPKTLIEFESS